MDYQETVEILKQQHIMVKNPVMLQIYHRAVQLAQAEATLLLLGESGTGKDVLAKLVHQCSPRRERQFVRLNCSALPEELFESELFGYEGQTFTGGLQRGKRGLLELADGGTLFLDEVGEMSMNNQVKLLRFLETGESTRLGSTITRKLQVRLICATHRDLRAMVKAGTFRGDLYYRLAVVELALPPLRERPEDVRALVEHFRDTNPVCQGTGGKIITPQALDLLCRLPWQGNVRQLLNMLERIYVLEEGTVIDVDTLGPYCQESNSLPIPQSGEVPLLPLRQAMEDFERGYLSRVIEETDSLEEAAQVLEIPLATLYRKKRKYGLYKYRQNSGTTPS